ncbi:MAG: glutathione S-transferase family protein [Alphaproteobacteria bacterium]
MSEWTLVIGDKNYSSWSLRPWLVLKHLGVPFAEETVRLRQADTKAEILKRSPSGKVPLLRHGSVVVWESLAICEYLAEIFTEAALWPRDREARALARAVSHEMHAGFVPLRQNLPMDVRARLSAPAMTPELASDIARITALWNQCRKAYGTGGPFLFGPFTIADAMFAPVTTRFVTYGISLDPVSAEYVKAVTALPAMVDWAAAAEPSSP